MKSVAVGGVLALGAFIQDGIPSTSLTLLSDYERNRISLIIKTNNISTKTITETRTPEMFVCRRQRLWFLLNTAQCTKCCALKGLLSFFFFAFVCVCACVSVDGTFCFCISRSRHFAPSASPYIRERDMYFDCIVSDTYVLFSCLSFFRPVFDYLCY